ncbi:unnamed protein product, partial [Meganyctiphanes norvegica]
MEVINLSDDDDISVIEPPKKKKVFRCLNPDCRTEKDLQRAVECVRRYFGVLSYPKKTRVCVDCSTKAKMEEEDLVEHVRSGELLMQKKLPPPRVVCRVLGDSDSDPTDDGPPSEESEYEWSPSNSGDEDRDLSDIIDDLIDSMKLDRQVTEGAKHLEETLLKVEKGFEDLDKEYAVIEDKIDTVRKEFYKEFNPKIQWVSAIEIGDESVLRQQPPIDPTSEIIADGPMIHRSYDHLPPVGPVERPELRADDRCYSMKYSLFARWVEAQVITVEAREQKPKRTLYKIRYNRKGPGHPRIIEGRQLAYFDPCPTRISVGTRVIGKYRDDDPKHTAVTGSYYIGIIAEIPTPANKLRYLIFFDDGYAQYVEHKDIRVVTEASSCPWEDVSSDSREFIREYLQAYPERPMVRLQQYNYIKTEWNGHWWKAQVQEVDGSLVKMFFPVDKRTEWIYRGSTRLSPLFNKKMNLQAQTERPFKTIRRRTGMHLNRGPSNVIEYLQHGQDTAQSGERRAVARKSTAARAGTPPREVLEKVEQEGQGEKKTVDIASTIPKLLPHECRASCLGPNKDSISIHKGYSPLLFPILFGWRREICKYKKKSAGRHLVKYVAPCGRRLRNPDEVFKYLRTTKSRLQIDCFSFEFSVDVNTEWEPTRKSFYLEDISVGEENVPISCVNSLDESQPAKLTYSTVRLPTKSVPLNLNPAFMVGCDCKDDCQNSLKCACHQLTIQSTRFCGSDMNEEAGYKNRRLYEQVATGIWECNQNCKCSTQCLNRVVQFPLRVKLQLFKTAQRGWGVRTLHDIPRGGFICIYVGKMLDEKSANEEGRSVQGGDDYYAELDFIENMEQQKEGYEEDVCDDDKVNQEHETRQSQLQNAHKDMVAAAKKAAEEAAEAARLVLGESDSDDYVSESDKYKSASRKKKLATDESYNLGTAKLGSLEKRQASARLRAKVTRNHIESDDDTLSGSGAVSSDETKFNKEEASLSSDDSKKENIKDDDTEGDKKMEESSDAGTSKKEESESGAKAEENDDDNDEEDDDEGPGQIKAGRSFMPNVSTLPKNEFKSVRDMFGEDESVYIMDAKTTGNIGRYLNHGCPKNCTTKTFPTVTPKVFRWLRYMSVTDVNG